MRIKLFLLKRLWDKISQTNFNKRSHIHFSFKMIQNMIKIILYVDSKLLDGFTIWPSINGTFLLDYTKNSNLFCMFNISEHEFSMCYGKYALAYKDTVENMIEFSGELSLETIEQHIKDFKTEYE